MEKTEKALNAYKKGASCSQSVLCAFAQDYSLDGETALALARGFGSGMATACTCGVISGAVMVIGLSTGRKAENKEAKQKAYRIVKEFIGWFEGRYGSTQCRVLLGCDMSNPEEARVAREKDLFTPVCIPMIRDTVEWLENRVTIHEPSN
jgi:C_GCAxxG_C_C family probable redox protein